MKPFEWVIAIWVAALCAAVVSFLLLPALPWATWVKDEKLAAWIQAAGSILAIIATASIALWQTISDRIQRKRQEHANAQVAGCAVLLLMSPIVSALHSIQGRLKGPVRLNSNYGNDVDVDEMTTTLAGLLFPTQDELTRITPVMPQCAIHLVRGRNLVHQFETALKVALQRRPAGVTNYGTFQTLRRLGLLELALEQFESANRMLDEFCV